MATDSSENLTTEEDSTKLQPKTQRRGPAISREKKLGKEARKLLNKLISIVEDAQTLQVGDRIVYRFTQLPQGVDGEILKIQILKSLVPKDLALTDEQWAQISTVPWPEPEKTLFGELKEKNGKIPWKRAEEILGARANRGYSETTWILKIRGTLNSLKIPVLITSEGRFLVALPKIDLTKT